MGLLDALAKQALGGQGKSALGGLVETVTRNPQILGAVTGLLSTRDSSIGGNGGLAGLVGAFQKKGLGDMMAGWISTGPNPPVSAAQLQEVLGGETLGQFARKAGVPAGDAGSLLASLLPTVIDHLTPEGKLPPSNSLEGSLASLLSGLGK
jgi:uncharacterized protein YidB (DUF937 family)